MGILLPSCLDKYHICAKSGVYLQYYICVSVMTLQLFYLISALNEDWEWVLPTFDLINVFNLRYIHEMPHTGYCYTFRILL